MISTNSVRLPLAPLLGLFATLAAFGCSDVSSAVVAEEALVPVVGRCVVPRGAAHAGTTRAVTTTHGGRTRSYLVHVPVGFTGRVRAPVVLAFHGLWGDATEFAAETGIEALSDSEGFVAVVPQGTGSTPTGPGWNAGEACCGSASSTGVDDVGFVETLLDEVASEHCVDEDRVFAMGMSNGGFFVSRLACELPERFAAIAPFASGVVAPTCTLSPGVSVLAVHGTADAMVTYDGSAGVAETYFGYGPFDSFADTEGYWVAENDCRATLTILLRYGDATCRRHAMCSDGVSVEACTVSGGEHEWPELVDVGFDGATLAWQFFSAHGR